MEAFANLVAGRLTLLSSAEYCRDARAERKKAQEKRIAAEREDTTRTEQRENHMLADGYSRTSLCLLMTSKVLEESANLLFTQAENAGSSFSAGLARTTLRGVDGNAPRLSIDECQPPPAYIA